MNNIETKVNKQYSAVTQIRSVKRDLRQAVKVINADYQQIGLEDQEFLTRVLYDAISALEPQEV